MIKKDFYVNIDAISPKVQEENLVLVQQSFLASYVYDLEFLNVEAFNILYTQESNAVPSRGGSSNDVLCGKVSYVWTFFLPATHNLNLFGQCRLKPFFMTHTPACPSRRT